MAPICRVVTIVCALLTSLAVPLVAHAAEIVALGASNTYGRGQGAHPDGVPRSQAWPAQLQALLAGRGCRAKVANAGIPGDTTAGMLARFNSAVGRDTRVLILQPGGNDARQGLSSASENVAEITRRAEARGIFVILLERLGSLAGSYRLPDGQHFSVEGHAVFANYLLDRVISAGACGRT